MSGNRFFAFGRSSVGVALAVSAAACSDHGFSESPSLASERTAESALEVTGALGSRPALGWNSFDVLATSRSGYGQTWLNEGHIKDASDVLAQKLGGAGYEYINID